MDLHSAVECHRAFLKGEYSATELAQYFLQRIEQYDAKVGAFLDLYVPAVLEQAQQLDIKRSQKQPLGKLAGVIVSIKDNIHVQGQKTTCASRFLQNYKAPFSATAVERLQQADALIVGKTNLDEFAMGSSTETSAYQITRNPWNLDCVPGGSSGGAAAAVAARMCPIALGSDTGGSVRLPAAWCGVVGFKPTYGRISRYGLVAYGSSLDQIGPIATTTADIALTMDVIGGHCQHDATSIMQPQPSYSQQLVTSLQGCKIGVPWHFLEALTPETLQQFQASIQQLKQQGVEIITIDLSILKYSLAVYYILATAEASTNLARFDGIRYGVRAPEAAALEEIYHLSREQGFGAEVKKRILLGTYVLSAGYQDAYYRKAQKVRSLIISTYKEIFRQCDCIAMPVSPIAAFSLGAIKDPLEMYLLDIFTISQNLAGLPCISVPAGFTEEQKPVGIQFTGAQMHDLRVLQVAHGFEQMNNCNLKMPSWLN